MSVKKEQVKSGIFHMHKEKEPHFSEGKTYGCDMLSQHDSIYPKSDQPSIYSRYMEEQFSY